MIGMKRHPLRWSLLALSCAFAFSAVIAPALAKAPKVTGVQKKRSVPNDSDGHYTNVHCPKGYDASGGGLKNSDPNGLQFFQSSYPRSKGGAWATVTYRPNIATGEGSATAFVRCVKGATVSAKRGDHIFGSVGTTESVSAKCPSNKELVGGGVELGDPYHDAILGTYPSGNGWKSLGRAGAAAGTELITHALCAPKDKVTTKRKSKTVKLGGFSALKSVSAKCPKHYAVTGGGTKMEDEFGSDVFTDSYPSGRKWVSKGVGSSSRKITSYAICVKQ